MDRCDECGYVYDTPRELIPTELRKLAPAYRQLLKSHRDEALRAHPRPGVWSALEYACHMRDVLRTQRERVLLAQEEEQPTFVSMEREERVVEERYNEQSPAQVSVELAEAAGSLADVLEHLDDKGWLRTGVYNYPVREVRTVEWIGRHTIHEGLHHLMDIRRLLETD